MRADRRARLTHQEHLAIAIDGDHRRAGGVLDNLAHARGAVGLRQAFEPQGHDAAGVDLLVSSRQGFRIP